MISKWQWLLAQFLEKLWVLAVAYAVLGLATVFLAGVIGPFLPSGMGARLGGGAAQTVLTILASSLLTVVTFSLGIMVSAFSGAAGAVSPRATPLLKADRTTQRVLSTFLGAFLFSLIGIIALQTGAFTENDRLVLFAVTLLVVALVIVTIFRWIAHLSVFGLMPDSIAKVEAAAKDALMIRMEAPFLGGHCLSGPVPQTAAPVLPVTVGYVRHLDMAALQEAAEASGAQLYLAALPGAFVHPGAPLLWVDGTTDKADAMRGAFTIGTARSFDQDPRFGLAVLTEIAERALSPAVNDPGTAIDILGRVVRLLAPWAAPRQPVLSFPLLRVPPLRLADAMDDVFPAIARDGARVFSVQMRLQKALLALTLISAPTFGRAAALQSAAAMARCHPHMQETEREALQTVADQIADLAGPHRPPPI